MAAEVWIRFIVTTLLPACMLISRLRPEMMPWVTVPESCPAALPIATARSPTCRMSESPKEAGASPSAVILTTARSVRVSEPTIHASSSRPSSSSTVTAEEPSTTWALVTMKPSSLRMMPLPLPAMEMLPGSYTLMHTTLGPTVLAISTVESPPSASSGRSSMVKLGTSPGAGRRRAAPPLRSASKASPARKTVAASPRQSRTATSGARFLRRRGGFPPGV